MTEVFNCQPVFYFWLLDHPDVAVQLWRGLGVQCTPMIRTEMAGLPGRTGKAAAWNG